MNYVCIKEFSVPYLDEHGDICESGKRMVVKEGSVWWLEEEDETNEVFLTDADVRLWREPENGDYIEITNETFKEKFEVE